MYCEIGSRLTVNGRVDLNESRSLAALESNLGRYVVDTAASVGFLQPALLDESFY